MLTFDTFQTQITIGIYDRKSLLVGELQDDSKDSSYDAMGLGTYSNSAISSYVSIFETLWKQSGMYEESQKKAWASYQQESGLQNHSGSSMEGFHMEGFHMEGFHMEGFHMEGLSGGPQWGFELDFLYASLIFYAYYA